MKIFLSGLDGWGGKRAMKLYLSGIDNGSSRTAMKVYLSSVEQGAQKNALKTTDFMMKWNLMSYWYLSNDVEWAEKVRDNSEGIIIDSGAFTAMRGANAGKMDWVEYTLRYAEFIKRFDRENVVGYFEMDIDNLIGYQKVRELRTLLEEASGVPEKIIPVWHRSRGVQEFKRMCEERSGLWVAISGSEGAFSGPDQAKMFLKEAWSHGCKLHALGITSKSYLNNVPFDSTDSSSWVQDVLYGKVGKRKVTREFSKTNRDDTFIASYKHWMKKQEYYYNRWKAVCND